MQRTGRFALIGALVGFGLSMPLFEISMLTILALDGGWFKALAFPYLASSADLVLILALLHTSFALAGALGGYLWGRRHPRHPPLRVIRGGRLMRSRSRRTTFL